ncbi:MAG: winged helix-turn-helix domain-containing protein [Chloroflexota bacterium]|nr:MAG: winged helix-turn-helix domain-containing protein [Chloroflexota bacterium]
MPSIELTQAHARRFLLAHQGLWPPYTYQGKAGILDYIRRVGCIQFDPLNIVGQNPDLVLQARVDGYRPAMLQELLYQNRKLLDGFDKNMSIYSVDDWPYFSRFRESARRGYEENSPEIQAILPQLRSERDTRGPLSSLDLDFDQVVDWSWAPTRLARAALESMYFWGELVVHHKVNTRKVYDFAHRHLPAELLAAPDPNPTDEQYHCWRIHRRIGAMGLVWSRAGDGWLGMSKIKSPARQAAFKKLLDEGKVIQAQVEGIDLPLYLRSQDTPALELVASPDHTPAKASILAPLDNLLWDRRLLKALFNFDYLWEVYKPVEQRAYGYYVLPVLYGDRFVARFEPVRQKLASGSQGSPRSKSKERQQHALLIRNWWWEPGVVPTGAMQSALADCLGCFANYLGADRLVIDPLALQNANLHWLDKVFS